MQLGMTVGELRKRMTAAEFVEWFAYASLEPFGEWRADARAGIIASTMANCHRAPEREVFTPADFMIKFGHHPEPEPPPDRTKISRQIREAFAAYSPPPPEVVEAEARLVS